MLISIEQNPSNFSVFNTSTTGVQLPFAVDWFSATGAGEICIPVDVASLNVEGVGDGSNVTLQAMFAGGDGNLFQVINVFPLFMKPDKRLYSALTSLYVRMPLCRPMSLALAL